MGHTGAQSGSKSDPAFVCRSGVPASVTVPQRVERQRANSLRLLSHLDTIEDVVLPRERPGARYNYHMFPVLLRDPRNGHR